MELRIGRVGAIHAALIWVFLCAAAPASAYEVLNNGKLRFGTGSEASVNANGNLQQPFYYDGNLSQWFKLTYSSYPLNNAIGIDGDGTNEWNLNGTIVQDGALTGQVLDVSGFTATSGSTGYGTIVSTGTVTLGGKTIEIRNTYTLEANKSYVRIVTRLRNTTGSTIGNVRLWVGTQDDWVGMTDTPTKQKGNLTTGSFVAIANAADRAAALQISSGTTGVLFYSTSPKANTSINGCCAFQNAYRQDPQTSAIQMTNDGSYALFVRMDDLASGASEEITWYYAAGELANLGAIATDVAAAASNYTVTATAGTGGTISPGSASVTQGATTAFTVTPSTGYTIGSVTGCSGSLSGSTYTTGAINAACTVTATFTQNIYTVTTSAGTGGSIGPASANVNHGSTTSFTVAPSAGYSIGSVSGCGGSLAGNTYTTGAVTANCAVTASFSLNSYPVTASAGTGGGSIDVVSANINHGGTAVFNITPEPGYSIGSVSGCSGTLVGNTFTSSAVTGACSLSVQFTQTLPVFTPAAPAVYHLNASALTAVPPADLAPSAVDYQGQSLAVTLVGGATRFEPGEHVLTWRAVDARGVAATVQQILRVWPTVSMGKDVSLGFRQGNFGYVRIALNGLSPVYPFNVDYTVTGSALGHDLDSGTAVFQPGETEKDIYFAILQTPPAGAPNQEMRVSINEGVNRGVRREAVVTLVTANAPPIVTVSGRQDGAAVPVFARTGGQIILTADVQDPNSSDTHTLQWTSPNAAATTVQNGRLLLAADSLSVGVHRFEVVATDNGAPSLSSRGVFDLVLREAAMPLPQGVQGWAPNGLPDDPAYNPRTPNILPERAGELHHYIVESDPGVMLRLGPNALLIGQAQAELEDMTSILGADTIANVGGYFDFIVDELPQIGQSVNVVLPQRAQIPQNPVYRKFNTQTRRWQDFVADTRNALASAPGSAGYCPPPDSDQYRPGLNASDWCVRLTINDGGPNDDDRQENGSISDPGGIAAMAAVVVTTTGGGGGGGGGSMDLGVLMLGLLALAMKSRRRVLPLLAATAVLPSLASADMPSFSAENVYFGGQLGKARGEVSEADIDARLAAAGYDVTADYSDRTRTAWRLFAGYRLNSHFAMQLGYVDLGEIGALLTGNVVDIQEFLTSANRLQPRSGNGVEVSVVGRYPLISRWSAMGRIGLLRWDSNYRSTDNNALFAGLDTHGSNGFFGAGVEFALNTRWAVTADWTRYRVGGEKIGFMGVGLSYR